MTWICVEDFRLFTASFELRAVDRRVFRHLSPRVPAPPPLQHDLHRHGPPSHHPVRGSSFSCGASCASIYRPAHFASPTAFVCCTAAMYSSTCSRPITTKLLLVKDVVRPIVPTVWRVGVRLAQILRHVRSPRRHAARGCLIACRYVCSRCMLHPCFQGQNSEHQLRSRKGNPIKVVYADETLTDPEQRRP